MKLTHSPYARSELRNLVLREIVMIGQATDLPLLTLHGLR